LHAGTSAYCTTATAAVQHLWSRWLPQQEGVREAGAGADIQGLLRPTAGCEAAVP
jgi:hypothetical protein